MYHVSMRMLTIFSNRVTPFAEAPVNFEPYPFALAGFVRTDHDTRERGERLPKSIDGLHIYSMPQLFRRNPTLCGAGMYLASDNFMTQMLLTALHEEMRAWKGWQLAYNAGFRERYLRHVPGATDPEIQAELDQAWSDNEHIFELAWQMLGRGELPTHLPSSVLAGMRVDPDEWPEGYEPTTITLPDPSQVS